MTTSTQHVQNIQAFEFTRRVRGFEAVSADHKKTPDNYEVILPVRGTAYSAGYDFICTEDIFLRPGEHRKVYTDVKAYMEPDEYLAIYPRSSVGSKGVMLRNTVAIVDSDYYDNESTGGNIMILVHNYGVDDLYIRAGDRFVQGIFTKYLITDDDNATGTRTGGYGHTGA